MTRAQRLEFFRRLQEANPEPTTELRYDSPFQLLVAVILSAQTTDRAVNKATEALFRDAPTAAAMAELGEDGIADYVRSIGLYRSKARHVAATCALLRDQHKGEVPRERAALEALPGVGRKTANVVLNTIFGESTIAVDTHLFRLANRSGLAPGKDVKFAAPSHAGGYAEYMRVQLHAIAAGMPWYVTHAPPPSVKPV